MRRLAVALLLMALTSACTELTRFDYPYDDEDASIDGGPLDAGPEGQDGGP